MTSDFSERKAIESKIAAVEELRGEQRRLAKAALEQELRQSIEDSDRVSETSSAAAPNDEDAANANEDQTRGLKEMLARVEALAIA